MMCLYLFIVTWPVLNLKDRLLKCNHSQYELYSDTVLLTPFKKQDALPVILSLEVQARWFSGHTSLWY